MRLSLLVTACVAATALGAQARPPADSARADTGIVERVVRDSVRTPFVVSPVPSFGGVGRAPRWRRDEIFHLGATNLAELIQHIPGAAILRSGLMLAPQVITWWGETGRVRVFLDGMELDGLDAREGTVRDIGAIPVWNLEEVVAEPTPAELRVYLRSWRVTRTTPETRVDVLTGDQQTNLYRGYYGRRFQSGLGVQFGFQQFATVNQSGGDGDAVGLFTRVGWARKAWSVDLVAQRDRRARNATARDDTTGSVPALTGTETQAYVRIAFRSPDGDAAWAQMILSKASFKESTPPQTLGPEYGKVPADTVDTSATRLQYVVSGGATVLGVRTTLALRYRTSDAGNSLSPSVRAVWQRSWGTVTANLDRSGADSLARFDLGARVGGTRWRQLSLAAQFSRRLPVDGKDGGVSTFSRLEAQVHFGGIVVRGGAIRRDGVDDAPPVVFARGIGAATLPAATGETFGVTARLVGAVVAEVQGTVWNAATIYRPQNEVYGRVGLETDWLRRFPLDDFTIRAFVIAEHRGGMLIPVADGPVVVQAATALSSMLEIRIKSATITWQFRNLLGTQYETVPGYFMPRRINFYGVRWNFSN